MKRLISALALTLAAAGTLAQDLLIMDATLHTMGSDGIVESADILISDGKIARIADQIPHNRMIKVINAEGRPVTPAFFAGITGTGITEVEAVKESVDSEYAELYTELMHPEFDVRRAYNPHSSVIPVTRIEGFGYALLAASRGDRSISGKGGLVRFDGGYRSFEGKPVVYIELSGNSADDAGGSRAAHWMLLEQAFMEAGTGEDMTLLSVMGRKALSEAKENGVFVFHANRAADIMALLEFADEHKIKAVVHGGREAWIVADALAKASVPVVLNTLDNLPANFESLGARMDSAALLAKAGVEVMFSSNETHNARKVRQVAGNAVANGMPHDQALHAMTVTPAKVFGGQARQIEVGAPADLVIWSADPLEVTTLAVQVIMGGKADPMVSRQTLLRDRYLPENPAKPRAYLNP